MNSFLFFFKRIVNSFLAELLSAKKQESYATTISWVRAKVSFAISRSALLCLKGSRTPRRRNLYVKDRDLEIETGQAGLPLTQQLSILYYWDVHRNFHFLVYRQLFTWKWRNDRRSARNLCNCVKKPEKNSGLQRGLNPWPRDYRCDALLSELWSHWRWEQVNCGFICSRERNEC